MTCVRASLTLFLFLSVALNGFAQGGMGVAEPPAAPRPAPPAAPNPYAMNPYGGGATDPGYPAVQPGGYGAPRAAASFSVPATGADPDRPLGVGDQVNFQIMEDREEPVSKRVLDTGEVDIPYIGRVAAAGKTCTQVAADIKRRLEGEYYFRATVRLGLESASFDRPVGRIYLSGLVQTPGPQDLLPSEKTTVSAAILKAGGIAKFGDDRHVRVTRKTRGGGPETFTVDVKAILSKGQLDQDREVRDGDYIFVPQKILNIGM